jgi:hypothetical protein
MIQFNKDLAMYMSAHCERPLHRPPLDDLLPTPPLAKPGHGIDRDETEKGKVDMEALTTLPISVTPTSIPSSARPDVLAGNSTNTDYDKAIIGWSMHSDSIGPYAGSSMISLVDKASGYALVEKRPKGVGASAKILQGFFRKYKLRNHLTRMLSSDSAQVYTGDKLKKILVEFNCISDFSPPYKQAYNGYIEQIQYLIMCTTISLLANAPHLSIVFWPSACKMATLLWNLQQCPIVGQENMCRLEAFIHDNIDMNEIVILPFGIPIRFAISKKQRIALNKTFEKTPKTYKRKRGKSTIDGNMDRCSFGVYLFASYDPVTGSGLRGGITVYCHDTREIYETIDWEVLSAVPSQ